VIDTESVERAASFWYLACEAIYNAMPQASLQKRPSGVRVLRTGAQTSILNGIISTTHEPNPDELVQHPVNRFNNYLAANEAPGA
jgi:hypothetical protein